MTREEIEKRIKDTGEGRLMRHDEQHDAGIEIKRLKAELEQQTRWIMQHIEKCPKADALLRPELQREIERLKAEIASLNEEIFWLRDSL